MDATDGKIEVNGSEKDFMFFLESFGQLSNKEVILTALDIIDKKLGEFSSKLDKLK